MRKASLFPVSVLAMVCTISLAVPTLAQDAKPMDGQASADNHHKDIPVADRYFRLDFVIREVGEDGKSINSRAYSVIVSANDEHPEFGAHASIRTGSRVPVYQNGSRTTFEYRDVGVNIDSHNVHIVHLSQDELSLQVEAEISSLAPTSQDANDGFAPVIRQNKWNSVVLLPLNKPTILFSSDNVSSRGKLQLELTAAPIK